MDAETIMSRLSEQDAPALEPGRYRHFKGGEYEVLGVARHSEDESLLVVYRPLYGAGGLWVRPLAMFVEQVCVEGEMRPRFERLGGLQAPD